MNGLAIILGLLAALAAPQPNSSPVPSKHIAKILSRADGSSEASAYKVSSVRDEYEILRALGLTIKSQSLVSGKGKPYDVLTVVDPATGVERKLWFDISAFFPEF